MQIEYAKELLQSARRRMDAGSTSRADQRLNISDAYYAVFHLLVGEAAARLTNDDQIARHLARVPDHGSLKSICEKISKTQKVTICKEFDVPEKLAVIAGRFVELYQARLEADYSFTKEVSALNAITNLEEAERTFEDWESIREHDAVKAFLLLIMVKFKETKDSQPKP